jgi:uncharacterized protein (DUF58 family)
MPLLPSRRLALLIAVGAAAFLFSTTFALLLDGALLVAVIVDAIAAWRVHLPRIERTVPPRIALGGSATITAEVRTAAQRTVHISWTDDPGPGLERLPSDVIHSVITPGSRVREEYRVRGVDRGRTFMGDVHVRVLGPLQLVWRQRRIAQRDEVVVQPGMKELQRHRALALHHRLEVGQRRVRELGTGREFERLREYVRGDDPRHIDWKATARRGGTIVRQFEAERSQSILIAIDAGRLMMERFNGRERLDHALAAALVLADAASVNGDSIGVLLFADSVQAYLAPARHSLARVADVLVSVDAKRVEPDYPAAFQHVARHLRRRSLVVLFADVIDVRASSALLEHLGASARRHLPLIVAMRNVELESAAQARVQDEAAAFHRAAAEELLQARATALNGIRRRGVLVADIRPDAAVEETMARYLEVKRRGLL